MRCVYCRAFVYSDTTNHACWPKYTIVAKEYDHQSTVCAMSMMEAAKRWACMFDNSGDHLLAKGEEIAIQVTKEDGESAAFLVSAEPHVEYIVRDAK